MFQKVFQGLEGKINGQALGAALLLRSLALLARVGQTRTGDSGTSINKGVSKSEAVAAGSDRLA